MYPSSLTPTPVMCPTATSYVALNVFHFLFAKNKNNNNDKKCQNARQNHNDVIKSNILNPTSPPSPFLLSSQNNHPLKWCFGSFSIMLVNKQKNQTNGFCLMGIHNDLALQKNKNSSFHSNHAP